MLIRYKDINFNTQTLEIILAANNIIAEYMDQGYTLTLRQLYYQFVARDLIENKQTEYKRLGSIINNGRLAGLIDWAAIEDRTRNLQRLPNWNSPSDMLTWAARDYHEDMWKNQAFRIEVWIEKDALLGMIENICDTLDVPYFSCRGYVSQSEMWVAAQRMIRYAREGKTAILLHLGDHDPSGIDMSRDIRDRLYGFDVDVEVRRIALNYDQILKYKPPPNPAKTTDSRYKRYILEYGPDSWELDALEPTVLNKLIDDRISDEFIDLKKWQKSRASIKKSKEQIAFYSSKIADEWNE